MKVVEILIFLAVLVATPAVAEPTVGIAVIHPWIALPPMGAPTAAGYATIRNQGRTPDAFLGASTPGAQKFELHSMSMTGGVMRMRPVRGGVVIASGQSLTLAPGGEHHFMVVGSKSPLKAGARIPVTLTFAKAGAVRTIFTGEASPNADGMSMP